MDHRRAGEASPPRLAEITRSAARWLLQQQDEVGGWGEQKGKPPNVLNTAESVISLLEADAVEAGSAPIQKAVAFLVKHQQQSGAWCREVAVEAGEILRGPDVLRTSVAIQALIKAGRGTDDKAVKDAIAWLLSFQHADGWWDFSEPLGAAALPTCAALNALMDARHAGATGCDEAVEHGLGFLDAKLANADGSFSGEGRLQCAHTAHAVLTLQKARHLGLPTRADVEVAGLNWLLRHPDAALRLVEEVVVLSHADARLNYHFLHMTDTMLVAALGESPDQSHRDSRSYVEALRKITDRADEDGGGGFFGHRVFSWSTARTISALWRAKERRSEVPNRTPEFTGRSAGPVILLFALVLVAVFVFLSATRTFGAMQALFLGFLMLACMVAYGTIGEKTFQEIIATATQGLASRRKADG